MTTTIEQIDLWLSAPTETQTLEFKEARTSFDREKLCKYCVALANEGGGQLLLGITDKPPRRVVGSSAFPNLIYGRGYFLPCRLPRRCRGRGSSTWTRRDFSYSSATTWDRL